MSIVHGARNCTKIEEDNNADEETSAKQHQSRADISASHPARLFKYVCGGQFNSFVSDRFVASRIPVYTNTGWRHLVKPWSWKGLQMQQSYTQRPGLLRGQQMQAFSS
ncbi:hypothetical protein HELRODRAFT_161394 [Helobdella robusta]|uniref:Uncharacterized protein n=1 Tax=Helobdella robusta TaxID=6412 RepID=T1ERF6_HELRO|nr:hypothetical protein HELRODRAFT_161394 [Helobdella robusta]ESO02157.1 hypothetical protein HELRODRAFT_161394 [Helobdella robusta]